MESIHHGDHLVQLSRFKVSNAYLVREEDGLTLIDTSLAGSAQAILAAASELRSLIRRIVITHAHSDHYGSLDALHAKAPDAEGSAARGLVLGDQLLRRAEAPRLLDQLRELVQIDQLEAHQHVRMAVVVRGREERLRLAL